MRSNEINEIKWDTGDPVGLRDQMGQVTALVYTLNLIQPRNPISFWILTVRLMTVTDCRKLIGILPFSGF